MPCPLSESSAAVDNRPPRVVRYVYERMRGVFPDSVCALNQHEGVWEIYIIPQTILDGRGMLALYVNVADPDEPEFTWKYGVGELLNGVLIGLAAEQSADEVGLLNTFAEARLEAMK